MTLLGVAQGLPGFPGVPKVQHDGGSPQLDSSIRQQLDGAAVHSRLLESVMQRELQALTPGSPQLQLARLCLVHRQQPEAQQDSGSIVVAPVLGLCLQHILADAHKQQRQQQQQGGTAQPTTTTSSSCSSNASSPAAEPAAGPAPAAPAVAVAAAAFAGGGRSRQAAAALHAAMHGCSPFLNALQCELRSLQQVSAACQSQLKQELAALGQYLPPAAPSDSSSSDSSRRDSKGSDAGPASAAAPHTGPPAPATSTSTSTSTSTTATATSSPSGRSSYYGQGLDLKALRQQADGAAYGLIHLEDFVSSSIASLAALAQRYDVLITAAVVAAEQHHAGDGSSGGGGMSSAAVASSDAAAASVQGRPGSSFLGPLLSTVTGGKGSKQPDAAAAGPAAYVLMCPGVCSHSNPDQLHRYRAGVPPDVYHTSMRQLLSLGSCAELVLWLLSVTYARLRHAAEVAAAEAAAATGQAHPGGVKEWQAPDKFMRSTTKYWIHPANILRLKVALIRHLPLLVYGCADPVSSGDIAAAAAGRSEHRAASLVSSVYFDSPSLDVYHTRLAREDGARLARIRYYGQRVPGAAGADQTVFVEQKTHKEKWTEERSFKERASLLQSQVPAYLSGQLPLEEAAPSPGKLQLLQQVQAFITESHQSPVLRTEYLRTAWQAYDNNAVRLSLDEHMLLLRERGSGGSASITSSTGAGSWCRELELSPQLPGCDAVRFPYGILEVKLADKTAAPAWVRELQLSGVLVEVPRFSKFLHGAALLEPQHCSSSPSWFAWDEAAAAALPGDLAAMWEAARDRRLKQEADLQFERDNAPALSPAAAASVLEAPGLTPLRVPRLLDVQPAPSKPGVSTSPCFNLTAFSGGWAQHSSDEASLMCPHPPGAVDSFPCHDLHSDAARSLAISSRASSYGSNLGAADGGRALGTEQGIMAEGQFSHAAGGATGWRGSSSSRGVGGSMQPGMGLLLPGGSEDSFPVASLRPGGRGLGERSPPEVGSSPTHAMGCAGSSNGMLTGASPPDVLNPLSSQFHHSDQHGVSRQYAHHRRHHSSLSTCSLLSTDSQNSLTTTSSAAAGLYHFSSSTRGGSPRMSVGHAHAASSTAAAAAAAGTPVGHHRASAGNRSSSSIATESWRLPAIKTSTSQGQLPLPASAHATPAKPADAKAALRLWSSGAQAAGSSHQHDSDTRPAGQDISSGAGAMSPLLGPVRASDVMVNLQLAAPGAAVPAAARMVGAGQHQVLQVFYTGSLGPVAGAAANGPLPSPSRRQLRQLSQLLPPAPAHPAAPASSAALLAAGSAVANGHASAAAAVAAEAGEAGSFPSGAAVDGVAHVSSKAGSGVRGKLRQWRAAVGGRLGRGTRGKEAAASGGSLRNGGSNAHTQGFTGSGPRTSSLVQPRSDPKTFFAAERTFLAWLHIAVLVMMTGLGLLTGSTIVVVGEGGCMASMVCSASRISGAIIAPVSICFMLYALYLYRKRTQQILLRSTLRYDDQHGPVLLTLLLVGVTLVCIVLALQAFRLSGGGGGGGAAGLVG